jgi:Ras-related GTP-binding protein C/D
MFLTELANFPRSFMDFQIWDFPGQLDYFDPAFDSGDIFKNIGALIWVIDAQDDYNDSLNRLVVTIMNLQSTEYRDILVEVFIHKTDGLPDEIKGDVYTDITSRVSDELADAGYINPRVTYHVTSIFDSSIFEALSRVIQKLIPELNTLQNLLNILADNTGMQKAYLFDINSKIYVASDTRPVDMGSYEMSSAMIDFVLDTIDLFNYPRKNTKQLGAQMDEVEASVTFSHDDSLMLLLKEVNR